MTTSLPPIWLIVLLAGLSTLSETVYSPCMPEIAESLNASVSLVEQTLTIYLIAFTIGILFWGNLSDKVGRKPCVIAGLSIFTLGCFGCYLSRNIQMLMLCRFIQAFGGGIGSVLSHSITRDSFSGAKLSKAYASVTSSLAIFPLIGPIIGGVISEHFDWSNIFVFLICFTLILILLVIKKLPETCNFEAKQNSKIIKLAAILIKDTKVITLGLIIAAGNGIIFSYCAEAPFYLINNLSISPSQYGLSFVGIALSTMLGGIISKKLQDKCYKSEYIMLVGITLILSASLVFSCIIVTHNYFGINKPSLIVITILSQMLINFGICMTASNASALALVNYKKTTGTASSLFGFFYYLCAAFITFGISILHNGSLIVMPLYFLFIATLMLIAYLIYNKSLKPQ